MLILILLAAAFAGAATGARDDIAGLLAADSAFSAASAAHGMGAALEQFLAPDAIVPLPGGRFARGAAAAHAALDRSAGPGRTVTWRPIRAGISADGTHGFTLGFLTITREDSAPAYEKYISYWERRTGEWRVRASKRAPSEEGVGRDVRMAPSLPHAEPMNADPAQHEADRTSLAAAESAFSEAAQTGGLRAAFARFGRDDAVNMGPPSQAFVVGAAHIGDLVGAGTPTNGSPVSWAADHEVIVSPAGDLGITFGIIRRNGADPSAPGFAFFTIWRREQRSAPWRYIAE
jgi:hypothetical protein